MINETIKLKKYLIGGLSDDETEIIDLQMIADEISAEDINFAENDLMEDYLEDLLSAEEIKLFNEHFLISEKREKQLQEISLLKKYTKKVHVEDCFDIAEKSSDSFFSRLKNLFSTFPRPAIAAFALLILTFGIGIAYTVFYPPANSELARLEQKYEEINRKDLNNLVELKDVSSKSLFPSTLRNAAPETPLKSDSLTENVLFRLALPFETTNETPFDVQVVQNEKVVFTQKKMRNYGQEIRLILPKSILQKGQVKIRLENPQIKSSDITYNFTVE